MAAAAALLEGARCNVGRSASSSVAIPLCLCRVGRSGSTSGLDVAAELSSRRWRVGPSESLPPELLPELLLPASPPDELGGLPAVLVAEPPLESESAVRRCSVGWLESGDEAVPDPLAGVPALPAEG